MDSRTNKGRGNEIKTAKKMKWRWAGHIARWTDRRQIYYIGFLVKRKNYQATTKCKMVD